MSIHNAHLAFYFPTIVTELCTRAGVEIVEEDELLQPMRAIDVALFQAKRKTRMREIPEDVFTEYIGPVRTAIHPGPALPQPQPRRRAIGDRVNELGAWATYQMQHQAVTDAHITHMEAMMQWISLHLGVDMSAYPPPPAFPAPFQFQYTYPMPGDAVAGVPPPDDEEEDL